MKKNITLIGLLIIVINILFLLKIKYYPELLYGFPHHNCHTVPFHLILGSGILLIAVYLIVAFVLFFFYEKKIDKRSMLLHSPSFLWFYIHIFSKRYKNVPYLSLCFAIFWASLVYYLGTILSVYILSLAKESFDPENNNPISFLTSPGILISFIIFVFSLWTFINTVIAKAKSNLPIDTLDDLTYYLNNTLFGSNPEWGKYSNIFYYVFDNSISLGHISDYPNYKSYLSFLRKLRSKFIVNFKAIVYNKTKLYSAYKKSSLYNLNSREAYFKIVEANDFSLFYLNSDLIYDDNKIKDGNEIKYIYFNYDNLIKKGDAFFGKDLDAHLKKHSLKIDEVKDDSNIITNIAQYYNTSKASDNYIFYTDEIGLTRFIVSNLFVIQFIASNNKNVKVPAGYISEDIIMIERYKNAFEEYLKS